MGRDVFHGPFACQSSNLDKASLQVTSLRSAGGFLTQLAYDAVDRRAEVTYANGTKATYLYDASDALLSLLYTNAMGRTADQFLYTYNPAGNRVSTRSTCRLKAAL